MPPNTLSCHFVKPMERVKIDLIFTSNPIPLYRGSGSETYCVYLDVCSSSASLINFPDLSFSISHFHI